MAYTPPGSARQLGDYGAMLQRRWLWIVLGVLLGLVAALAYMRFVTPTYLSTAQVQAKSTIADSPSYAGTPEPVNLDTEAQLVKSTAVATRAAGIMGDGSSPEELTRRLTVTVPPNSDLLDITFEAPTAAEAQRGAQAFAVAYLETREEFARDVVDDRLTSLEAQVALATEQLQEVTRALSSPVNPPSDVKRSLLQNRKRQYTNQLRSLQAAVQPLEGAVIRTGRITLDARLPTSVTRPDPRLVIPSGLMLGLLFGLALAALRERTDRRVHSSADVETPFALPVLAQLDTRKGSLARPAVGERLDRDLQALFHAVESAGGDTGLVSVATARGSELDIDIARALGAVAARTGIRSVHLTRDTIDGPAQGSADDATLGLLEVRGYRQYDVVAEGAVRPVLMAKVLQQLGRERDFVVADMPTGDPAIDLPVVAHQAGVMLMAIELGHTARTELSAALALLSRAGATRIYAVTVRGRGTRGAGNSRQDQSAAASPSGSGSSPKPAFSRGDAPDGVGR